MSLYRYKKIENYENYKKENLVLEDSSNNGVNAWNTVGNSYDFLQALVNASFIANLVIPSIFIITGLFFVWQYVYPEIKFQIEKSNGLVAQGTVAPAADDYLDRSSYISNPAGLNQVAEEAFASNILQEDSVSKNYTGTFFLTIPSIGIESLPVQANVDSTVESIYNSVLTNSLAHFENTGLPISDVNNNIVLYGHSASPSYNPQASDPEVAFSFLQNLKVGDEIHIDMEGKRYSYRMYKSKIVEPDDFSVITGEKNRRKLTLFTCYPAGNNANRLVVEARPI